MDFHMEIQAVIAALFAGMDGTDINVSKSSGISYVTCIRKDLKYMFSVQTKDEISHFILRRSDIDKDGYLLVTFKIEDIVTELFRVVENSNYIIQRNEAAIQLQILQNPMTK